MVIVSVTVKKKKKVWRKESHNSIATDHIYNIQKVHSVNGQASRTKAVWSLPAKPHVPVPPCTNQTQLDCRRTCEVWARHSKLLPQFPHCNLGDITCCLTGVSWGWNLTPVAVGSRGADAWVREAPALVPEPAPHGIGAHTGWPWPWQHQDHWWCG